MENTKAQTPFGMRDKLGYAAGDFGCNMSFAFINSYLMLFFVTCMKIKSEHFAIIILLAKIFDAINDPIIGNICDSAKVGKDGKFKPWIKWGSIPLLLTSIAMFIYVPNAPYVFKIIMCLLLYCIWSICYTAVNVPYGSMQSVITDVPSQRSELSTWRSIGAMLAQLPIMIIVPRIVYDSKNNPKGEIFIIIVAIMGILGFIAFYFLRKLTTERIPPKHNEKIKINYLKTFLSFLTNRNILGITIATIAQIALINTVTTSMQYLFMVYFKQAGLLSLGTVIAGCPVILGIAFSKMLLKKFTKRQLCSIPFIVATIAAAIITFVKIKNPYVWLVCAAFIMFGTSFFMVLTWAMFADCIDEQEMRTNKREEGSLYATYSLFRKIAQGVGAALVAFAIGKTGYDAHLQENQPAIVADKIYTTTGALVLIGSVLCFVSLFFLYKLNDDIPEKKKAWLLAKEGEMNDQIVDAPIQEEIKDEIVIEDDTTTNIKE